MTMDSLMHLNRELTVEGSEFPIGIGSLDYCFKDVVLPSLVSQVQLIDPWAWDKPTSVDSTACSYLNLVKFV